MDPEDVLDITKTKFKFDAKVTGGVASGKIKITGKIDELGIKGTLMTADLEGAWEARRYAHRLQYHEYPVQ